MQELTGLSEEMVKFWGPPVSIYGREQAVEDGVLVDLRNVEGGEKMAGEAGFKLPVLLSAAVFEALTPRWEETGKMHPNFPGRLWDVLYLGALAIRGRGEYGCVDYTLRIGRRNWTIRATLDGVSPEGPAIHLIFPGED